MQENLVEFILKNKNKLISSLKQFNPQTVEDAISLTMIRLVNKPREVNHNWNWARLQLKNTCIELLNKKEESILQLCNLDENGNNRIIDSVVDEFDLIEKTIEHQNQLELTRKLYELIDLELTVDQKESVLNFLRTGRHKNDSHKNLYSQAKRRLIDVVNNPKKSFSFKQKLKAIPGGKFIKKDRSQYRKKGVCGRKPTISSQTRDNIINDLILGPKGYNVREVSKKYNVSRDFIRKELMRRGISFTQLNN